MALIDVIKGILGKRDESLAAQEGFLSQADSEGINFYLEPESFRSTKSGRGTTLQRVQLIALRMLEEQGLALPLPNGFKVLSPDVAGLDDEHAEVLMLPPRFPGSFQAQISGRTGQSSFRVNLVTHIDGLSAPFQYRGPLLYLSSQEVYRLTPAELLGLEAVEHHQGMQSDQRGEAENLRLMAKLQTAARSGMRIDLSHFDRLEVVVPENIGVVATRLPDGSLMLCPSLGDGSTPDDLDKRWAQLDLDADGGVLRIDNRVVLLESERMEAIKEVLGNRRIPADKVPEFFATPSAFLDAALVDLDLGFSVRVSGVGKFQHMEFGELDASKQDWFALESHATTPDIIPTLIKTPEELDRFKEVFSSATQQGATAMSFAGENIDISAPEVVQAYIEQVERSFWEPFEYESPNSDDDLPRTPKETVGVLLREAEEIRADLLSRAANRSPNESPIWSCYARAPFPHQSDGIEWMLGLLDAALEEAPNDLYRLQGALLADDMGLGKTYMTLVTAGEYLARQKRAGRTEKPILVVAPLSLLENWEDEVGHTFKEPPFRDIVTLQTGRDLSKFRVKGAERESVQLSGLLDEDGRMDDQTIRYALSIGPESGTRRLDMARRLVLTTYQTLRDYQFSLCKIDWGMVIFDEAQNIKNPNAMQTRAAKGLKADFKLLATGTPVENSLGDFWCLLDTAQPGLLGDWTQFRDSWIKPILDASDEDRDRVRVDKGRQLRDAVGSFMLRRVKEDQLKGLPSKTIYSGLPQRAGSSQQLNPTLSRPMSGMQLQAYDAVLDKYRVQRATEDMRGRALAVLQQLREVSLHPRLREVSELLAANGSQFRTIMAESAKLKVLLDLLDEIKDRGEKVILFMVTKRLQRMLKLWLDSLYGLETSIINGDTAAVAKNPSTLTRKQLITAFEAKSGFNILIMSPVAAGVGLTVVGANHVVHLERHWNPAKEAQATDRVYRIGQTKDVHIHLPMVTHPEFSSFDVHLDNLLRGKLMLKDAVVTPEAVTENEMIHSMGL